MEEQTTTQFNDFATLALAPTVFCAARRFPTLVRDLMQMLAFNFPFKAGSSLPSS